MSRDPPLVAYYVVEVDVAHDREEPLFATLHGPFPTRERAERERDSWLKTWEQFLEEQDENPYDFKGWNVVKKHITDFQIDRLDRMDTDRHETMTAAADAMAASLLADEGIGPMADDE